MLITTTLNENKKRQSFGNIGMASTQVLRFLNNSPAIGATFVDLGSMTVPRTIIDFTRSKDAGMETGIREFSGTSNHTLIGAYGLLASGLLALGINNKFGVKANKVFANFDCIDTLGSIWGDILKGNPDAKPDEMRNLFFEKVLRTAKGSAQNSKGQLENAAIDEKSIQLFMKELKVYTEKNPNSYTLPQKLMQRLKSILTYSTSAESEYIVKNGSHSVSSNSDTFIKTMFSLGKTFSEPKALEEFRKSGDIASNVFIKSLKKSKMGASLLGIAIAMGIGASVQPFNVWLTKKRTGKEGFVGVEGCNQDKSKNFTASKLAAAGGFLAFAYATIVDNIFKTPLKKQMGQFFNRMQFNGIVPSIPQLKAVYAFTIASRLMAARDKNELRESLTKDFIGFVNWLILGDFVQKIVANASNKNLTNYSEKDHGRGLFAKIFKTRVKTHDEILFEELKKANIDPSQLLSSEGKMLSAKELIKKFSDKLPDLKTRLRGKNIAQLSGYLYSALVLGILMPKLNIYITNHMHKKKSCPEKENTISENITQKPSIPYSKDSAFKAFENFV